MSADLKLVHPFRLLISGSSGTGKTTFLRQLLAEYRETMTINKPTLRVLYMYGQEQQIFREPIASNVIVEYVKGFTEDFDEKPDIIIIDDLMSEAGEDKRLTALFTKGSHHMSISVCYLIQNLFFKGKESRTISLNASHIVAMRNPRDKLQLQVLGRQIFPQRSKFFNAVLDSALSEPFSHLLIDLSPSCPDDLRLRQRASVKGVRGYVVYVPS